MNRQRLVNDLVRVGERALKSWLRQRNKPSKKSSKQSRGGRRDEAFQRPQNDASYPGDYTRMPQIEYAPVKDDVADPGEIVWTWVPFEEDFSQGKDRPVLIISRDGTWLLALQVSTVNDADHRAHEEREGRYWVDIGSGAWDNKGRPSEVRVNRIIRIKPDAVRRIGARLDEDRFRMVANEVKRHY